ncbi:MAG: 5'/3'-nucleotidase SurE [Parasphingorhabdus sp.]|nr:5'/3'-nucleotidase SurE [Parasphingorhabdus sp.]
MRRIFTMIAMLALGTPVAAEARNIVLTNDDGLTSNVVALYNALKADGHDVIVSVPCQNQSAMGAALGLRPLTPLEAACKNDAAGVGAPGAGPMTREGLNNGSGADFYYVNSTPIMALLYGLDVIAMKRWGGAPDLVLSGPNEGQNVGAIVISSGTVSAAQSAALRGLPAIALSAGQNSAGPDLANAMSPVVARQSTDLVTALDKASNGGRMLPAGLALNVNFPDDSKSASFCASKIGTYNGYALSFSENMAAAASPEMKAMAKAYGQDVPALPGILFGQNSAKPAADQMLDEWCCIKTASRYHRCKRAMAWPTAQ